MQKTLQKPTTSESEFQMIDCETAKKIYENKKKYDLWGSLAQVESIIIQKAQDGERLAEISIRPNGDDLDVLIEELKKRGYIIFRREKYNGIAKIRIYWEYPPVVETLVLGFDWRRC